MMANANTCDRCKVWVWAGLRKPPRGFLKWKGVCFECYCVLKLILRASMVDVDFRGGDTAESYVRARE